MTSSNAMITENDDVTADHHHHDVTKDIVDMEPVLHALGLRGLYPFVQLTLQCFSEFFIAFFFVGTMMSLEYVPTYRCSEVNSIQLDAFLGQDVLPNTTVSLEYQQCSIDVTFNTSGAVTTHSLSCVNGINFSVPYDTSIITEWSLVCDKDGIKLLMKTITNVGLGIGAVVFSNLSDLYGRKKVYVICSLCALVTSSGACLAPNYYVLLVSRVLTGATLMGISMVSFTMFVELLPLKCRSVANPVRDILWLLGSIFLAVFAYVMQGISWRYINLFFSAGFLCCLLLSCFLDESVLWLMATGNITEVERILRKASRLNRKDFNHVKKVLHAAISESRNKKQNPSFSPSRTTSEDAGSSSKQLLADANLHGDDTSGHAPQKKTDLELSAFGDCNVSKIESDGGETELKPHRYTFLDICRHRVVLIHLVVISCLWSSNGLFHSGSVLGYSSLSESRFLNLGLVSFLEIVYNIICIVILCGFHRKPLGTFFGMVCSLTLIFPALMTLLVGVSIGKTLAKVGWFLGNFSVRGSFSVLSVVSLEVFPTCIRTTGPGTAAAVSRSLGMLATYVADLGKDKPWAPGLIIGSFFFLTTLTIRFLPETRHRKLPTTIEEIKAWTAKDGPVGVE